MRLLFRAVASYFYARPPLAIFLASLLSLSVTTLGLGLYTHYDTNLLNLDVLNWSKLTSEMSKLKYCLHTELNITKDNLTSLNTATQANIPIVTDLSRVDKSPMMSSVGNVSLDMLGLGYLGQENITVILQTEAGTDAACVRVEAEEAGLVKSLLNETVGQATCLETGHEYKVWTAHVAKHVPHTWCSRQGQMEFSIKLGTVQGKLSRNCETSCVTMLSSGMETYLTQSERNTMWRHLLVSSLILVLATASVIFWAATVVNRDLARDMTLLPSEVRYPQHQKASKFKIFRTNL